MSNGPINGKNTPDMNFGPQVGHLYLEDSKSDDEVIRQIIVHDGGGNWWIDPIGSDCIEGKDLDAAVEALRNDIAESGETLQSIIDWCRQYGEEHRNPAWDHFFTLEDCEYAELCEIGGSGVEYRYGIVL